MTKRLTSHKLKLDQTWDVNQVKLLTVLLSFLIATILTEVKDFFWVCLVPADFNKQIYGFCGTWGICALSRKIGEKLLTISFFSHPFQFSNPQKGSKICCFPTKYEVGFLEYSTTSQQGNIRCRNILSLIDSSRNRQGAGWAGRWPACLRTEYISCLLSPVHWNP